MITAKDRFRFGCYWLCMGIFAAACDKEGSHHSVLHKTVPSVHRSDTQQTQKKTLPMARWRSPRPLRHKPPTTQPTVSQPNRRDPSTKPTSRKRPTPLTIQPSVPVKANRFYLVVIKHKNRLYLFRGSKLFRTYRVAIGSTDQENEDGEDKQEAGDDRTPVGVFKIDQAVPVADPIFGGYWMRLDTTLKARHIYNKKYKAILQTWEKQNGLIENDGEVRQFNRWAKRQNHPLIFRGIGIHGGNWSSSYGCIVMNNTHVRELYNTLMGSSSPVGVRVEIRP